MSVSIMRPLIALESKGTRRVIHKADCLPVKTPNWQVRIRHLGAQIAAHGAESVQT